MQLFSGSAGKESTCNVGDLGSIPGLRRSPEEGKGYPLHYSGLENFMDCIVHGVTQSQTWLSDLSLYHFPWLMAHQFSSVTQSCLTLCDPLNCSKPGLTVYHQLSESTQTHVHWVRDAVQPSHPLSSPSPALNLSQHQGLLNESALCIRWPKYWGFSFNTSPSNEHPGLISFRMDWLNLLAVQGTLQHHSSKASIFLHSPFFVVQLSHPYTTTGKTIALTRWTFVDKVMSLLFNNVSAF